MFAAHLPLWGLARPPHFLGGRDDYDDEDEEDEDMLGDELATPIVEEELQVGEILASKVSRKKAT